MLYSIKFCLFLTKRGWQILPLSHIHVHTSMNANFYFLCFPIRPTVIVYTNHPVILRLICNIQVHVVVTMTADRGIGSLWYNTFIWMYTLICEQYIFLSLIKHIAYQQQSTLKCHNTETLGDSTYNITVYEVYKNQVYLDVIHIKICSLQHNTCLNIAT